MEKGIEELIQEYISRTTGNNQLAYGVASAARQKYPQMDNATRIVDMDYIEPTVEIKSSVGLRHVEMSEYIFEHHVPRSLGALDPPATERIYVYAGYDPPTNTFYMHIRGEQV